MNDVTDDPLGGDALLRAMFDGSALGIAFVGQTGHVIRANPALSRLLGYSQEELTRLRFAEYTHPDDRERDLELFREMVAGGLREYRIEKRFIRKDGGTVWARLTVSRVTTKAGDVLVAMVEDVTEARTNREQSSKLFSALGERLKELRALHRWANVLSRTQQPLAELLPQLVLLLPPAFRDPSRAGARIVFDGTVYTTPGFVDSPLSLDVKFTTPNGKRVALEVSYSSMPHGEEGTEAFLPEEKILLGSASDMLSVELDRRSAEDDLRKSQERLRLALTAAEMGVWEWDVASDRVAWSEQLAHFVGHETELSGHFGDYAHLVHPDEREWLYNSLREFVDGPNDSLEIEFRLARPDGGYRRVSASALRYWSRGKVIRVIAALSDVTHRRMLEAQLRQTQKMEALGLLAGGVAHDFNNYLSVIVASAALLAEQLPADDPRRELAVEIEGAAAKSATLTRQLLAFSRKSPFQPSAIDVPHLIEKLHPLLQRLAGDSIKVLTDVEDTSGRVWADAPQLEQVLVNLVVNARDAMPRGGDVRIGVHAVTLDERDTAKNPDARPGSYVCIAVVDNGRGIPPELVPHIFEPFFTTKEAEKGTGLGLAVVFGAVQQAQGHIVVDSDVGHGTTFAIYLPRIMTDHAALASAPEKTG
ncbi:two-component system sensor histidine kinase NtrB [Labilithrix luteola]|uniref:two-component system sensor histidine kinase NtrB n=1 Tax=Labilithrix luteola TaxID=1391654 RepID=UPI0011BA8B1E|nr:PAS domain-containing hybrid sensor histidine kinase/response regulator [Labilithrix luteola]